MGKAKLRDPFLLSVLWCCQPWVNKASRSGDLCETFKGKTRACKNEPGTVMSVITKQVMNFLLRFALI